MQLGKCPAGEYTGRGRLSYTNGSAVPMQRHRIRPPPVFQKRCRHMASAATVANRCYTRSPVKPFPRTYHQLFSSLENSPRLTIEVRPTAFGLGLDLRLGLELTLTSDLHFQERSRSRGQRSVGSKVRVETDGRTDGGDCIACRANAVSNKKFQINLGRVAYGRE